MPLFLATFQLDWMGKLGTYVFLNGGDCLDVSMGGKKQAGGKVLGTGDGGETARTGAAVLSWQLVHD